MAKKNPPGVVKPRKREDGRYEVRITLGCNPVTGKQVQKSFYGKTSEEASDKARRAKVAFQDGLLPEPSKLTLGNWLSIWQRDYLCSIKTSTVHQYEANIRNNILPYLGRIKLTKLSPDMIQRVYNALSKPHVLLASLDGKRREVPPLTAKSIKNVHGTLHKALDQAVKNQLIKLNPADAVVLPRVERKEARCLEQEEARKLLQAIKGHRYENIFIVTLFTGMRQGEVLGLTWDCVDFSSGSLTINKQLQQEHVKGGQYSLVSTKTSQNRKIQAAEYVFDVLRAERKNQTENRIRAGKAWKNEWNLCFTDELGSHFCNKTVYANFKRIVTSIGLPSLRFHDLRHSFAALAVKNGIEMKVIQETLGHSTMAFTANTYAHVMNSLRQESAKKMQNGIDTLVG